MRPLLLFAAVVLAACDSPVVPTANATFGEARVYVFDLVEARTGWPAATDPSCQPAQSGLSFASACWQTLTACPDGRAEVVFDDVSNRGRYAVEGRSLTVSFDGVSEVGLEATYRLSEDAETTVLVATGGTWVRQPGGAETCSELARR